MSYNAKIIITKIIILSVIWIVIISLFALNIWLSVYCHNLHHTLYLNEFNAQMSMLGFYDKEINILNQTEDEVKLFWCMCANVFSYILILCGAFCIMLFIDDIFWWW